MKAVVAAFNQEKALVGAFSVITNLPMQLFEALTLTLPHHFPPHAWCRVNWTVAMQGKEASVPNVLAETEEVTSSLAASSYSLLSQREPGQQVAWCRMCLHTVACSI